MKKTKTFYEKMLKRLWDLPSEQWERNHYSEYDRERLEDSPRKHYVNGFDKALDDSYHNDLLDHLVKKLPRKKHKRINKKDENGRPDGYAWREGFGWNNGFADALDQVKEIMEKEKV